MTTHSPLSPDELATLERLASAATQGEWSACVILDGGLPALAGDHYAAVTSSVPASLPGKVRVVALTGRAGKEWNSESIADAEFIAFATPERIARLCRAAREGADERRLAGESRARMAGLLAQILARWEAADTGYQGGRLVPITNTMRRHIESAMRRDDALAARATTSPESPTDAEN